MGGSPRIKVKKAKTGERKDPPSQKSKNMENNTKKVSAKLRQDHPTSFRGSGKILRLGLEFTSVTISLRLTGKAQKGR